MRFNWLQRWNYFFLGSQRASRLSLNMKDSVKVLPMYSIISAVNGGKAPLILPLCVVVSGQLYFPLTHHFVPREVFLVPI